MKAKKRNDLWAIREECGVYIYIYLFFSVCLFYLLFCNYLPPETVKLQKLTRFWLVQLSPLYTYTHTGKHTPSFDPAVQREQFKPSLLVLVVL